MMKAIMIIFIVLIIGCDENVKQKYKLSDKELAHLLFDLHFADVILPGHDSIQRDSINTVYWQKLSEHYQLTEQEIREEIKKLESEPEKLKLILNKVKIMADSVQI